MTINREKRQNRVLETLVKIHIETTLPVGSKHIADVLKLSSATIRNVLFEFESNGYVRQPYTSAGRIPTDLGYRKYVNNLMYREKPPSGDIFTTIRQYIVKKRFFEEVIEATSHAASEITKYTAIALSPNNRFYFDGTYHMLEQPEFREPDMARDFLKLIEDKTELVQIMNQDRETTGTRVRIGRENLFDKLRECTVITSAYKIRGRISGNIGIIGPMRMEYERIVPAVENLAEITSETLEEILP